jgi:hypothetical protein
MPVATVKVMALYDELKTLTFPWFSYLPNLDINTHCLNLLRDFQSISVQTSKFKKLKVVYSSYYMVFVTVYFNFYCFFTEKSLFKLV